MLFQFQFLDLSLCSLYDEAILKSALGNACCNKGRTKLSMGVASHPKIAIIISVTRLIKICVPRFALEFVARHWSGGNQFETGWTLFFQGSSLPRIRGQSRKFRLFSSVKKFFFLLCWNIKNLLNCMNLYGLNLRVQHKYENNKWWEKERKK